MKLHLLKEFHITNNRFVVPEFFLGNPTFLVEIVIGESIEHVACHGLLYC